MNRKSADHYLGLPYPIELLPEEGGFIASHPDLDGCLTQGETAEEALKNLAEARALWIEARLEAGLSVPEPLASEMSGRFLVRTTPGLHGQLTKLAQRQGVSLNQLVNVVLAEYAGGAPYRNEIERLANVLDGLEKVSSILTGQGQTQPALTVSGLQGYWDVLSPERSPLFERTQIFFAGAPERTQLFGSMETQSSIAGTKAECARWGVLNEPAHTSIVFDSAESAYQSTVKEEGGILSLLAARQKAGRP